MYPVPCIQNMFRHIPNVTVQPNVGFNGKTHYVFIIIWQSLVSPVSAALLLGDVQEKWININTIHNTNIWGINSGITNTAGFTQNFYIVIWIDLLDRNLQIDKYTAVLQLLEASCSSEHVYN